MSNDPTRSRPLYDDPDARKLSAPSSERNAGPISTQLQRLLAGGEGTVVEIGAGSGQHSVVCAKALPHLDWQPTDPDAMHLASIEAWGEDTALPNLRPPVKLDATTDWGAVHRPARAVFCSNVIHIAPWFVAEGVVAGAAKALAKGGSLIFYGPFFENGAATEGNVAFDRTLRERDPSFGVRDTRDVLALTEADFALAERIEMPANNLMLVFERR